MRGSIGPRFALGCLATAALALLLAGSGCDDPSPAKPAQPGENTQVKKTAIGRNVELEIQKEGDVRRVVVHSVVVDREGQLEGFLTRKGTKEHEYILAADCDARDIHKALLVARAVPGNPVIFGPGEKFTPPSGSTIKVSVRYMKDGKQVVEPGQKWIRDAVNKKTLEHDWIFGGSRFVPDPEDKNKPPFYEAHAGDLICVVNMSTAMMDLPIKSPKNFDFRVWEANKDVIPPLGTRVDVILEPVPEKKEPDKDKEKDKPEEKSDKSEDKDKE
jgi:hypothetical protein